MKATLHYARITPKKMNLIAGLVRHETVDAALSLLKFTPKKAAKILYRIIRSAAANAQNNYKQKREELVISEIIVTDGPVLKRGIPIARGRMHPIKKRMSHITVTLTIPPKTKEKKTSSSSQS